MNEEERRVYAKKYREDHREESRESSRKYYRTHKKKQNKDRVEHYKKTRKQTLILLGSVCFFCGREAKRMMIHEKRGKKHKTSAVYLAIKNPDDFVLLCCPCHRPVHWCMKYLNMTWEDIKFKSQGG